MKVEAYRDLIDDVLRMTRDFHACANDDERLQWATRAGKLRLLAWSMEGEAGRATAADKAKMQRAKDALGIVYHSVEHLIIGDRQILGF